MEAVRETARCCLAISAGSAVNNFGRDKQYGTSNLSWFFGQNSGGPQTNPCIPNPGGF